MQTTAETIADNLERAAVREACKRSSAERLAALLLDECEALRDRIAVLEAELRSLRGAS